MSKLDNIVDVRITIESPVTDSASFSNLLLIVPAAETVGSETMPSVAVISSADDLLNYGYSTADAAYKAAAVAFMQEASPERLYVVATATGEDSAEVKITEALTRAATVTGWYGVALVGYVAKNDLKVVADWCESNNKLFGFTWSGNVAQTLDVSSYTHTFSIYVGETGTEDVPANNLYANVAYMSKCFAYEPGAETWNLKTLNGITPSILTSTRINVLKEIPTNYFHEIAGKKVTQDGKVGTGEWIDVIRFRDYLINEIQVGVFELFAKSAKIPFTDAGITGVQNVLENILTTAQKTGGIAADSFDEDDNIVRGYTVTVPRASEIPAADKEQRKLRGVTFTAKLAGAIHETVIRGTLEF